MKHILYLTGLFLLISCSKDQFSLKQYSSYPVKFQKQKVIYPDNSFEIYLPKNWYWQVENYGVEEIILGIESASPPDSQNFLNLISIQKTKGFTTNKELESEYLAALEIQKNNSNLKLIEAGETKILEQKTYFIHSRSNTGKYGEVEEIIFITKSKNDSNFYYLAAGASRTKDLKMNMAIMIQCLKTFKENI